MRILTDGVHLKFELSKPWVYLLIPDDQILGNATLDGLVAKFATS
jgi:type III restriction enzyme